jgi:hypothetical protein
MQASIMLSYYDSVAFMDVVQVHGRLHHGPIKREKDFQQLANATFADHRIARFSCVMLAHSDHLSSAFHSTWGELVNRSLLIDTQSNSEMEIEKNDGFHRRLH